MIDFIYCNIEEVIAHKVGNKTNGDDLILSDEKLKIDDLRLRELLLKYFTSSFSNPEYYSFTFSNDDFTLNPLYKFSSEIFSLSANLLNKSKDISKLLFDISLHPQIKSGDLFVVYFSGVKTDGEKVDALGIFKSENVQSFLKLNNTSNTFNLDYDKGINPEKLDKGCLILNTEKENGYKVCVIDKSNKISEAQFWKESFLNIKPIADDFHFTKNFLSFTKKYITNQAPEEFEISKADRIDLLNKTMDYFKTSNVFNKSEFENEVLQDETLIKSFNNFSTSLNEENIGIPQDSFDISSSAVKKQSRSYKSVLKLDKNFHIYIHGDKDLI